MSAFKQSHTRTIITFSKESLVRMLKTVGAIERTANVSTMDVQSFTEGGMTVTITSDIVQTKLDEVEQ